MRPPAGHYYHFMLRWTNGVYVHLSDVGGDSPKVGRKSPPNIDRLESCVIRVAVLRRTGSVAGCLCRATHWAVTPALHLTVDKTPPTSGANNLSSSCRTGGHCVPPCWHFPHDRLVACCCRRDLSKQRRAPMCNIFSITTFWCWLRNQHEIIKASANDETLEL